MIDLMEIYSNIDRKYPDLSTKEKNRLTLEKSVRIKRDELIAKTDWMALSDISMTQEWQTYRQALRDIPDQAGFPEEIEWPQEPEA